MTETGSFVPEGPVSCSENGDSGSGEELGGAMEGATEEHPRRGRLRPWTEVILEQTSSKNTLPNGLADPLDMGKLEL